MLYAISHKQKGITIFLAVVVIAVSLAAVLSVATIFLRELRLSEDIQGSLIAIMAADAGVEMMLYDKWANDLTCGIAEVSQTPMLEMRATDSSSDDLRYKLEVSPGNNIFGEAGDLTYEQGLADAGTGCHATPSPTGCWQGRDGTVANSYKSGTIANFAFSQNLSCGTIYYWRSSAIDPLGSNTYSGPSGSASFQVAC